ncbi:MAG: protein translocase subunit SecF [Candidatus Niyogibacteria bacterium]|nr:protein translocase subunit SecF [Candidatus Niyogibacteria bacterium]
MNIIKLRKFSYILSGTLVVLSIAAFIFWGFKWGIDFTGGSLVEVAFLGNRPEVADLTARLEGANFGAVNMQPVGDKNMIFRLRDITEEEHQTFLAKVADGVDYSKVFVETRFDSVGPVIGKELKQRSVVAIILVLVFIILFIAFAFRQVSYMVSSWKYGVAAIIALAHDIFIPSGVFAALGHFKGVEVDVLFVTALLTILGFSVYDTIVVFDRIRENLKKYSSRKSFEEVVGESLAQIMGRSLATSFALLLVVVPLFLFGAASIKYFSLVMIIGIIVGTYSSIFIASPLLVTWQKYKAKK